MRWSLQCVPVSSTDFSTLKFFLVARRIPSGTSERTDMCIQNWNEKVQKPVGVLACSLSQSVLPSPFQEENVITPTYTNTLFYFPFCLFVKLIHYIGMTVTTFASLVLFLQSWVHQYLSFTVIKWSWQYFFYVWSLDKSLGVNLFYLYFHVNNCIFLFQNAM